MRHSLITGLTLCLACVSSSPSGRRSRPLIVPDLDTTMHTNEAHRHEDLTVACPAEISVTITPSAAYVRWREEWQRSSEVFHTQDPFDRTALIRYVQAFPYAIQSGHFEAACEGLTTVDNYLHAPCSFQSLEVRHIMRCSLETLISGCGDRELARRVGSALARHNCGPDDDWYQP